MEGTADRWSDKTVLRNDSVDVVGDVSCCCCQWKGLLIGGLIKQSHRMIVYMS